MKSLIQREWRLLRWPLLGALVAQLTFLFIRTQRAYSVLLESDPSVVGLLLAVWLGYHRFYAEQRRGTWLLQPFPRTQLVLAKVIPASAALLVFALVESLSRYAWVATSNTPSGPILSLVPYLREALNVALGSTLALFFAAAIASFSERRWVQVVGIAAGLAWLFVATAADHQLRALTGHGGVMEIPSRAWHGLGLAVIACLGAATLVMTAREFGRRPSAQSQVIQALWRTPFSLLFLLFVADFVPDEPHVFRAHDHPVLLRDGEIVVARFDEGGGSARRRDGRVLSLPGRWSDEPSERASLFNRARAPLPFGHFDQFFAEEETRNVFVAEDRRSLVIYPEPDEEHDAACWGAHGMQHGTVHCEPGPTIIAVEQINSGEGVLFATNESVHVVDEDGAHLRFRAPNIQAVTWIRDEEGGGSALAVFTEDALTITGAVERRCPAASREGLVGLLDDNTVAILDGDVVTYCREAGSTTAAWPLTSDVAEDASTLDLNMAMLLPFAYNPLAAHSTWWIAGFLRLLGAAIVLVLARKRGLIHALIGLVLGPGYLLAAIVSETDVDIVAIVRERILRTAGSR